MIKTRVLRIETGTTPEIRDNLHKLEQREERKGTRDQRLRDQEVAEQQKKSKKEGTKYVYVYVCVCVCVCVCVYVYMCVQMHMLMYMRHLCQLVFCCLNF